MMGGGQRCLGQRMGNVLNVRNASVDDKASSRPRVSSCTGL